MPDLSADIAIISRIGAVPTILDVVCRTTGMGFAVVARVTECQWVACSVLDHIRFGLQPGGELATEATFCEQVRQHQRPVIIDHADKDEIYQDHPIPRMYGFQSYISVPIVMPGGKFFGTLCALDPKPAVLKNPGVIGLFTMFAELIGFHIDAAEKLAASESDLKLERENSELREQFIAVLGHDLRSPLGAITMGVELLKEGELEEQEIALVEMMGKSTIRMFGLIDDVMDFARGRLGGGISLEGRSEMLLDPVLAQVIGEMRANWPDRVIDARLALMEPVSGDPKRLAQLFTNLLGNALTHGKAGTPVTVTATSANGYFEFSVINASDPIPAEVIDRLFEPFSRGDAGDAKQGLGLGLYIASQIAKSHGGTLEVVSNPEETRFTFIMAREQEDF